MKNLSTLLKWCSIVFLLKLISLIYRQSINLINLFENDKTKYSILGIHFKESLNNTWLYFSNILLIFLLFYISYKIITLIKVAINLEKNLLFTTYNSKQLYSVSIGIIVFTSILIILKTPINYLNLVENDFLNQSNSYYAGLAFGSEIAKHIYLYIIAVFILIISSLIKNGEILKQENDLTI
jgi:hypothetical protein